MIRTATSLLSALAVPAMLAGAQATGPAQTTTPPVKPKHHSLLKGAAAGAVGGHYAGKAATGHGHAVLGAVAGIEAQHLRNKREKRAYQEQRRAQQSGASATTP